MITVIVGIRTEIIICGDPQYRGIPACIFRLDFHLWFFGKHPHLKYSEDCEDTNLCDQNKNQYTVKQCCPVFVHFLLPFRSGVS